MNWRLYEYSRPATWLSPLIYERVLAEEALRVGVSKSEMFSTRKTHQLVLVRSRAWKRLNDDGHSLKAISRTSGYDHTSIMWAIKCLPTLERKVARKRAPPIELRHRTIIKFPNPWGHGI